MPLVLQLIGETIAYCTNIARNKVFLNSSGVLVIQALYATVVAASSVLASSPRNAWTSLRVLMNSPQFPPRRSRFVEMNGAPLTPSVYRIRQPNHYVHLAFAAYLLYMGLLNSQSSIS